MSETPSSPEDPYAGKKPWSPKWILLAIVTYIIVYNIFNVIFDS